MKNFWYDSDYAQLQIFFNRSENLYFLLNEEITLVYYSIFNGAIGFFLSKLDNFIILLTLQVVGKDFLFVGWSQDAPQRPQKYNKLHVIWLEINS